MSQHTRLPFRVSFSTGSGSPMVAAPVSIGGGALALGFLRLLSAAVSLAESDGGFAGR